MQDNDWLSQFFKIKSDGTSPQFSIDDNDIVKLLRDAGIIGLGAAVAYLMANISNLNLGDGTYILIPALSVLLNLIYKWIKDNSPKNTNPDFNFNQRGPNQQHRGGPNFKPDFTPDVVQDNKERDRK